VALRGGVEKPESGCPYKIELREKKGGPVVLGKKRKKDCNCVRTGLHLYEIIKNERDLGPPPVVGPEHPFHKKIPRTGKKKGSTAWRKIREREKNGQTWWRGGFQGRNGKMKGEKIISFPRGSRGNLGGRCLTKKNPRVTYNEKKGRKKKKCPGQKEVGKKNPEVRTDSGKPRGGGGRHTAALKKKS